MRKHEVLLSETARRQLNDLPEKMRERVRAALSELADDPFRPRPKADIKPLRGPNRNYYRQRIGDYRAIYVVEGEKVRVAKILARRRAYAWLDWAPSGLDSGRQSSYRPDALCMDRVPRC